MREFLRDEQHMVLVPKYASVGSVSALLTLIAFYILTRSFQMYYLYATGIAYLFGRFVAFFMHKYWTFFDTDHGVLVHQMMQFLLLGTILLMLDVPLMYVFVDLVGLEKLFAQIVALLILGVISYTVSYLHIFNNNGNNENQTTRKV